MRPVTDRFRAALGVSHKRATTITCTAPGGSPVPLAWTSGSVSSSNSTGVRYQAGLTLAPTPGFDTYGLASTPGAIFRISHGIDYGAGDRELIDCGVYEAASGGVNLGEGDVSLTLVDLWQRVERCRFLTPHYPANGTRSSRIVDAINGAMPSVETIVTATGGNYVQGDNLWDRDRTTFIKDMATDGALDAAFDASGAFRIRAEPNLDPNAAVWTYRTGAASNIASAERERPFDRLYNTVIVIPVDATQIWERQTISLFDSSHPRHPSKIGVVPFFYGAPTLTTAAAARAAGVAIFQRVIGTTETLSIDGIGNPALEVGDVVSVVHEPTDTDPGFQAAHIIDSWQMDLVSGSMDLATRSSALAEVQES